MTPEGWRQVTDLFHAAIARPAEARSRFVDEACAGDTELRADVSAMLEAHDGASGASGAHDVPAVTVTTDSVELEPGAVVGPYAVHGLIGAGGMGRVYRARDSRLDREVAIKVLPSLYAADADRGRRFEQEVSADGRFLLVLADEREMSPRDPNVILHIDDELRRRVP